jgi:hypothetical protein
MKYEERRKAKQAGIHCNIYNLKLKALDALNILDDLLADWNDKLYLDDTHKQVVANIKTIEEWRKLYLKRLLEEK